MNTNFATILSVEARKLRGTSVLVVATLLPVLAVAQGGVLARLLIGRVPEVSPWGLLYLASQTVFAPLGLPVLIALLTALVARVEHQRQVWKQLFALPVARPAVFAAKLLLTGLLLAYSLVLFSAALLGAGLALGFAGPPPWATLLGRPLLAGLAALPILGVQFYLSYRFSNVFVPLAAAALLTLPALLVANSETYWVFYPWVYPTVISLSESGLQGGRLAALLAGCVALFAGLAGLGVAQFSKRDIM